MSLCHKQLYKFRYFNGCGLMMRGFLRTVGSFADKIGNDEKITIFAVLHDFHAVLTQNFTNGCLTHYATRKYKARTACAA
jgi:hypothetical protein